MAEVATIKAIEAGVVHQIQSGQVIVDLCSVAKELVENSLDAGATAVDVRFKNQGLDSIEVQDNGCGIAPQNYGGVALKHYTSKLSSFADLDTLHTFGFRGEALSSLCALSHFTVTTCLQSDVPRGTKLEFEVSGKLKSTSMVAAQKGTMVTVETLFHNLPVRRRELERNIKREWGKVINLLNQYACIQTGIKFTVSQQPNKGKRTVLFSTKGNKSTRENIVNVFGAKTLSALITLDLELELEPTTSKMTSTAAGSTRQQGEKTTVHVRGHISRPARGEGRQTPDRQMFYVNGRPCALPQFAKVFNEVYRTYNSTQSPFIFADIQLDTHLYDVNVSPDKRSILLHDQGRMLDNMREALIELFEKQDITIPVSHLATQKLTTPFKTPTAVGRTKSMPTSGQRQSDVQDVDDDNSDGGSGGMTATADPANSRQESGSVISNQPSVGPTGATDSISAWAQTKSDGRPVPRIAGPHEKKKENVPNSVATFLANLRGDYSYNDEQTPSEPEVEGINDGGQNDAENLPQTPSGAELCEDDVYDHVEESPVPAIAPPRSQGIKAGQAPSAFQTLKRPSTEVATITIGDQTVTSVIGESHKRQRTSHTPPTSQGIRSRSEISKGKTPLPSFKGRLTQMFAAASARISDSAQGSLLMDNGSPEDDEGIESDGAMSKASPDQSQVEEEPDYNDGELSTVASSQTKEQQILTADSPASLVHEDEDEAPNSGQNDQVADSPSMFVDLADDDDDYVEEEEKKRQEEEKVQKLIYDAEKTGNEPSKEMERRSQLFLKGRARRKDSTLTLVQHLTLPDRSVHRHESIWRESLDRVTKSSNRSETGSNDSGEHTARVDADGVDADTENAEEKLSLTITKSDFAQMKIIGQFNLGFILAVREAASKGTGDVEASDDPRHRVADDELFIIDQHASDEKYNFERLQASTVVESQRLVRPKPLELTALEEEIIIENQKALETNGFMVEVDESGESPVGSRCRLLSLPLSRETTFSLTDLEELVSLLADNPTTTATTVPRPSRVRKMFAMRACRSSVMVGRALSRPQMEKVVRHMGGMEKPWNCPHGRPTMRHLCGLSTTWDGRLWKEGDGFDDDVNDQNIVDLSVYK